MPPPPVSLSDARRAADAGLRAALAILALGGGCGSSDVGRTTGGPLEEVVAEPSEDAAPARAPGRPYAAHPIAPFAEAMTDLALAAVRGGPLPEAPVTLAGPVGPVHYREGVVPPEGPLVVLGFAFELELVLKRGDHVPDAEGAERWGSVHAVVGVTRHGLRLVELRPRRVRPERVEGRPPAAMVPGVQRVADDLLADLGRGDLTAWALGEEDRALLGNDAIWARLDADRPRDVHVRELGVLVTSVTQPRGVRLGDLAVLIAPPDGRLLSVAMRLEPEGESYRLRAAPLVEVGQVWPILASTELR